MSAEVFECLSSTHTVSPALVVSTAICPDGFAQVTMVGEDRVLITVSRYDGSASTISLPVDAFDTFADRVHAFRHVEDLVPA